MDDPHRMAKTVIPSSVPITEELVLTKRLPERRGYAKIEGVNPQDGAPWDIRIAHQRMDTVARRGLGPAKELAHLVPWVLKHPTAIYQGIRDEGESEWLCYCAVPPHAFRWRSGEKAPPYPGQVYLVFVNADRVAYNNRWDECDPRDPKQPIDYEERFTRRVLP